MANPICLSPLKFYDSYTKQNHRKSYAYGHISPLIMKLGVIDAFQLIIPDAAGVPDQIIGAFIYDALTDRSSNKDYIEQLRQNGLTHKRIGDYTVVTYPGILPIADLKLEGEYYIRLKTNDGIDYYSEVFCFTNDISSCLTLSYSNPEGYFYVKNGVVDLTESSFIIRFKSELGKPEYKFEEEATKRLGYSFIESQVSQKIYKFNAVLPEYLCDALRLVRLCSNKKITTRQDEYDLLTFDMDVDWQDQGDLASVTCEFQIDNVVANLGGYSNIPSGGDFNKDYNADFKTD